MRRIPHPSLPTFKFGSNTQVISTELLSANKIELYGFGVALKRPNISDIAKAVSGLSLVNEPLGAYLPLTADRLSTTEGAHSSIERAVRRTDMLGWLIKLVGDDPDSLDVEPEDVLGVLTYNAGVKVSVNGQKKLGRYVCAAYWTKDHPTSDRSKAVASTAFNEPADRSLWLPNRVMASLDGPYDYRKLSPGQVLDPSAGFAYAGQVWRGAEITSINHQQINDGFRQTTNTTNFRRGVPPHLHELKIVQQTPDNPSGLCDLVKRDITGSNDEPEDPTKPPYYYP